MDPDACWQEILSLARDIRDGRLRGDSDEKQLDRAEELAEHVGNLEEWLKKGGFPPAPLCPKKM